jgi:hypothetical protein
MASRPLTSAFSAFNLTTAWQTIYVATESDVLRTGIDAAVFNNYTASNASFSVRIVQSGTATVLNELITDKDIRANSNDLASAIIGQTILVGGTMQAKASANDAISATGTVTEIIS